MIVGFYENERKGSVRLRQTAAVTEEHFDKHVHAKLITVVEDLFLSKPTTFYLSVYFVILNLDSPNKFSPSKCLIILHFFFFFFLIKQ